jgi:D-glutamate cyclase
VNVEEKLTAIRDLIQQDIGNRGLRRDPDANLINACPGDFAGACRSLAEMRNASLRVVTGFFIPYGEPPAAETDGPLGAVFLARALTPLGINVTLATDVGRTRPLEVGLAASGLSDGVPVQPLQAFEEIDFTGLTHLLALERCGPSHSNHRCLTMRGVDVSDSMFNAELMFEEVKRRALPITTIGIGDGGNEIGMGKVPWDVIRRNIPNGDLIACRVPTDYLIVAGVSNWGAYAVAAGVWLLRGKRPDPALFDLAGERKILQDMVANGPLVDGVTGKQTVTVDGLAFERYAEPLLRIGEIVAM